MGGERDREGMRVSELLTCLFSIQDMCVSVSQRGVCLLHSIREASLMRQFHLPKPGGIPLLVAISSQAYVIFYTKVRKLFELNVLYVY